METPQGRDAAAVTRPDVARLAETIRDVGLPIVILGVPMKIVSLQAENIKRVRAVSIDANGHPVIVLAGENEQGKTSVLDAIEMALRNKRALPPMPVHDGAKKGKVVLDMGEYVVTRTFTPAGGGTLTITAPGGMTFKSPQSVLDKLIGDLTFDPMAFAEMSGPELAKTLRTIAGIDTTAIDHDIDAAEDERRLVMRDSKVTAEALDQTPAFPEAGTEVFSPEVITAKLERADAVTATITAAEIASNKAEAVFETKKADVTRAVEATARAQADVEAAQARLAAAQAHEAAAREAGNEAFKAWHVKKQEYALAIEQNATDDNNPIILRQAVADATEHNRQVQANLRRADIERHLAGMAARVAELDGILTAKRAERAALLNGAAFPITGLGLTDAGMVTWNGLPFEQASEAIKLRVSVAIGMALNPTLRVILIRNGNDLGKNNLAAIAQMAAERDYQVWIERIEGGVGQYTVTIEDGAVAGESEQPLPHREMHGTTGPIAPPTTPLYETQPAAPHSVQRAKDDIDEAMPDGPPAPKEPRLREVPKRAPLTNFGDFE